MKPFPFIFLAILALLAALWAGLMRLGWELPALTPALASAHGPLMISGFLGTLITLERAVAEPMQASPANDVFGALLVISAALQWLAGVAFIANTWRRVRAAA